MCTTTEVLIARFVTAFKSMRDAAWHNYHYVSKYPNEYMAYNRIPICVEFITHLANTCIITGESLLNVYDEDQEKKECIQKFINELKRIINNGKIKDVAYFYTNFIFLWEDDNEDWIFKKK